MDHIVSHHQDAEGKVYFRVRWFGYERDADTWEPLLHIPEEMVRRYVRRKKLNPQDFRPSATADHRP